MTQTLPRTLIEQEGFQGVLSDGEGRKYQLKKKSGEWVSFLRGQRQKFSIVLEQIFRLNGCKLAVFVHKQIARFFLHKISPIRRGTVWHFVLATSIP
ncbi:MAG: hypothetical protein ABFD51_00955 [Anaerolineaceae bacterium]